jgi:GNAT superfamily N-acetyltransferase
MRIVPMDKLPLEVVVDVFNRGFKDYVIPVQMDSYILKDYIFVNDISLADSFAALDDKDVAQAFTFTGLRGKGSWVGGLAVDPGHRGLGFGKAVLAAQVERVKKLGQDDLWLECLEDNDVAMRMYQKVGFKQARKVHFMQCDDPKVVPADAPEHERRDASISEVLPVYDKEHIWPKAPESLRRLAGVHIEVAVKDGNIVGYLIAFPGVEVTYLWDLSANVYGDVLLNGLIRTLETKQLSIANLHSKALLSMLQKRGFVITYTLEVLRLKLRQGILPW